MVKNRKDLTPRRSFRLAANKHKPVATANVKVVVRVRPQNARESGENSKTVVKVVDDNMLMFDPEEDITPFFYHGVQQKGRDILKKPHKNMKFSFDRVFGFEANNEEIFQHSTKNLIETIMDGCNCSVFVYGATGAGKTHTMLGHNEAPGITYLTMQELFKQKEELSDERDFELAVSYLEVYNENVQDLLKPGCAPLHLREDSKLGVMVAGIYLKRISNPDELFELLERGNKNRTQHPTDANAESSRSHAVFQVYIRMNVKSTGQTRLAKLSMIDLAGSERGAATGCKGVRFTEGSNINKSLLALGNCINSLADGQRHVPYRDSKLTRLLKDSLGGNCHTIMIANISPSSLSFEDTYNTLKYATRAKKIKSNIKKNVVNTEMNSSQYLKIIEELNLEIAKLKERPETGGECEKCKTINTEEKTVHSEGLDKLKTAYEEYKSTQERLSRLNVNKRVLETRVNIKEEANNRLSDFYVDTPEKEKVHKKLEHTMDRLKKQAHAYSSNVDILQQKISIIQENITDLLKTYPELQSYNELESLKIEHLRTTLEMESIQNMNKIQEKELELRGVLLEQIAKVLQPWFLILRGSGLTTETMAMEYQSICNQLQGACTVSFDDGDAVPNYHIPANITKCVTEDETRATKRKLTEELDSTFVLSSPSVNKGSTDRLLTKVCPSPAKRFAKPLRIATRTVLTENKLKSKIGFGTMGTSSRFPTVVPAGRNANVKLLTKQALPQNYKRTK